MSQVETSNDKKFRIEYQGLKDLPIKIRNGVNVLFAVLYPAFSSVEDGQRVSADRIYVR